MLIFPEPLPCVICEGTRFKPLANLGLAELAKCRRCGLIVNRVSARGAAKDYYGQAYDGLYDSYYKSFRQKQFKEAMLRLQEVAVQGRRALDVGCSYGWFLKEAKAKGWEAVGTEPSAKVFGHLAADNNLKVFNLGAEAIGRIPGTFDLVTMWNVFEHLGDPNAVLALVRDKLNTQGVALVCVPNSNGLITRMSFLAHHVTLGQAKEHLARLYQMDNDFPHLFHYSRENLEAILRKNGLAPFSGWGQDIVDADNIGERLRGFTGDRPMFKQVLTWAIKILQGASKVVQMEDEIVVLARRM